MHQFFDHLVTVLQLLATDKFVRLMGLVDTARSAYQAIDADAIEQSGLGAEADIGADIVNRVDGAGR